MAGSISSMLRAPTASACSCVTGSLEQDHELIATETRGRVDGAHGALEAPRDLAQQIIAGPVPERVVDELEAIEVDHQHRELMRLPLGLGDGLGDAVIEQQAVRQPGEDVVRGEVAQLPVGGLEALGAVGHHPLETLDMTLERARVLPFAAESAGGTAVFRSARRAS